MTKSPYNPLSLHAGKNVSSKTSEFGSCGYVSGLAFTWCSFFAERYASESFQILGTLPVNVREQCYKS